MPRDLFGDVSDPSVRVGSQSRYTVPLSLLAHLVVIVTLLLVPLMATGMLPEIRDNVIFVGAPRLPEPPAPQRAAPPERRMPVAPDAAPVDVPRAITPETGLEVVEHDVVGIDGAIPGVVGGEVDGVLTPPPPPPAARPQEPVPVGGKVSVPAKVRDLAPIYPPIAQSARIEGVVILRATIGVDGRVTGLTLLKSIPLLDQAAMDAVRQWEYSPTLLNGVPVPVVMTVTVRFDLR
jgi:periplasmic protein TonB